MESKSLYEPGMPDYENCQCESIKSHGKTGATTRLRQMTCVPKPYELTANKAPVAGSLRVWQPHKKNLTRYLTCCLTQPPHMLCFFERQILTATQTHTDEYTNIYHHLAGRRVTAAPIARI